MSKRKIYHKPEIKQVKLTPQQALATGCKLKVGGAKTVSCDRNQGDCELNEAGS